ncbi:MULTISPECIES: hypothetical protein [Pyrobaculum]|jgi:hypothetical protein|uniref:Uncharacterized protein n=1 Tax=Pyrobaculum aerophilum (strain ATCC 51768 / DSM 7523 / JCM 9630 / CIP 104966 / NBRC 100827 / IM2) TaxID=178306 RepID=Q8ZXP4_PYRAE|nr:MULTISPECIES: hypothetical protein [Pyrobaculum]AAL63302.1 hypothetical protein PAE1176 [Pyrobaculum aerophilum str. IM2]MCX8136867.1 hypothetical protein [Pyrobaculum aerophilum]
MSKEVIYYMLHSQVIRILESLGAHKLALEVERAGMGHEIYDYLDRAFSLYYAEYGGVNCRWLKQAIENNWDKVVGTVLPGLLRQYLAAHGERGDARRYKTSEVKGVVVK